MAQSLGQVVEGTLVKLNENGSPVEFYVAMQGYESGLNGAGRVLLVRKDVYSNRVWDSGNENEFDPSSIDTWLNGTYKALLDADIQSAIGQTDLLEPGRGSGRHPESHDSGDL